MLGLGTTFYYHRCIDCRSIQIAQLPRDLSSYYPKNYYSFNLSRESTLRRRLRAARNRGALNNSHVLAFALKSLFGESDLSPWLSASAVNTQSKILDVGCGSGSLLSKLQEIGFKSLTGIDPYMSNDSTRNSNEFRLIRTTLDKLTDKYDLIMFHHSLEHVTDPENHLINAKQLLERSGRILVRIPIANSFADRNYGGNWVQLDAPRHLSIPSMFGFQSLVTRLNLSIVKIFHDSHSLQFFGSELYKNGSTLTSHKPNNRFSKKMHTFKTASRRLNDIGDGDSCCFLLCENGSAPSY